MRHLFLFLEKHFLFLQRCFPISREIFKVISCKRRVYEEGIRYGRALSQNKREKYDSHKKKGVRAKPKGYKLDGMAKAKGWWWR